MGDDQAQIRPSLCQRFLDESIDLRLIYAHAQVVQVDQLHRPTIPRRWGDRWWGRRHRRLGRGPRRLRRPDGWPHGGRCRGLNWPRRLNWSGRLRDDEVTRAENKLLAIVHSRLNKVSPGWQTARNRVCPAGARLPENAGGAGTTSLRIEQGPKGVSQTVLVTILRPHGYF